MTTGELLKKCIDKDKSAWDEFIRRYRPLVLRSARYKLNILNRPFLKTRILEDIVQEVFFTIWQKDKLKGLRDASCVKSWLVIVTINTASNYCRKNIFNPERNTFSMHEEPSSDMAGLSPEASISSVKLDTGKMLEANELKSLLDKEISKLSDKEQLALKFNIYEGKKQKDIARIMNVPEGTVATLISRAKLQLKEKLKSFIESR